jgi:chaperonin cofactor prefoldin
LNQVIVEDEKFLKISSDLQNTANLTKTNFEQFDESTKALNDWVKKQRKFVDGVVVLIAKLDELNKIRDYGEQFWRETRNSMNEGVSIIKDGTETLNSQVSTLNKQFYNRLSTTLTELDNCIQALINRAEENPF